MCEKCEPLMMCRVGHKERTKISKHAEMVMDRYENSFDVFVRVYDMDQRDGLWWNHTFDVKYCPFCGEEIRPVDEYEGRTMVTVEDMPDAVKLVRIEKGGLFRLNGEVYVVVKHPEYGKNETVIMSLESGEFWKCNWHERVIPLKIIEKGK